MFKTCTCECLIKRHMIGQFCWINGDKYNKETQFEQNCTGFIFCAFNALMLKTHLHSPLTKRSLGVVASKPDFR